jgi:hypothetical protein
MDLSWITQSDDPIGLWNFLSLGSAPPPPEVVAAAAGLPLTAAGAPMAPEDLFRRQVAERRARDGIWDGRSRPTVAVLAAASRRGDAPPMAPRAPARRDPDRWAHVSPERFQAELDAYRAAKVARGTSG